ncbi:MAG: response regulator [Anaerolineae bacterium]|nr:response regulator [Anaerolineae bacterium]
MLNPIRILVIDDHQNWQKKLPELLQRLNNPVQVDVATTYEDALWHIASNSYDLATVDLSLAIDQHSVLQPSQLMGLDLVHAFRESQNNANCSLIILTGYPTLDETKQMLRNYRIIDFIDKGEFDNYTFIELIQNTLLERSSA